MLRADSKHHSFVVGLSKEDKTIDHKKDDVGLKLKWHKKDERT